MADDHEHEHGHSDSRSSVGTVMRAIPAAVLLIALVVFAAANTDETEVDLVFTDTEAPLFVVLLGTAVVGALIASLLRFRRKHHH